MARAFLLGYAEEERRRNILRIERRRLRDASDPLQLPEREFIGHFRLTKLGFQQVLVELSPRLPIVRRNTGVCNELKILAALNFYANGSYQRNVGASFLLNMSQPTFSKCLHEGTGALNTCEILRKYIKFPMTQHERKIIMKDFMKKFEFPGVIGCIDGTHVALIRPKEHEETYFNRKNYHSLNVLVCLVIVKEALCHFRGARVCPLQHGQCSIRDFLLRTKLHLLSLGLVKGLFCLR
ncbi:unnamed protein product, partial [Brenthis ino]